MRLITRWFTRTVDWLVGRLRSREAGPKHLYVGRTGEDDAYFFLRKLGYVMVARNWRTPKRKGEVDLIGWDGDVLCFIEVKTRTTRAVKPAEAAVDNAKQKELRGMAREYLRRVSRSRRSRAVDADPKTCRFDVVSVYYDAGTRKSSDITLFRSAFSLA